MGSDTLRDECRLSVRLPNEDSRYLGLLAAREHVTVSVLVRRAVRRHVVDARKAYGEGMEFPPLPPEETPRELTRQETEDVSTLVHVLADTIVSIIEAYDGDGDLGEQVELASMVLEDWAGFELADGWRFHPRTALTRAVDDGEDAA